MTQQVKFQDEIGIDRVDDFVALKPADRAYPAKEITREFGEILNPEQVSSQTEDEWAAFSRAGWYFVPLKGKVKELVDTKVTPPSLEALHRVFIDQGGRIHLGLDRLHVQLNRDLTGDAAVSLLYNVGLLEFQAFKSVKNLFVVRVTSGTKNFLEVAEDLSNNKDFEYAEPDFLEYIPPRFTPGDADFGQQWQLKNTGQEGGTFGADIKAETAWDTTRGAGVRIAVIDNGFSLAHPDLIGAVDPQSAYFQLTPSGPNFIAGSAAIPVGDHGTICAGLAVARSNVDGICGVANQATLMAIACLPDQLGTQATLARAIYYAADPSREGGSAATGADVISCSLGSGTGIWAMQTVLKNAIDFAVTKRRGGNLGTPIFWAASNKREKISKDQVLSHLSVIAVGRSTRQDLMDSTAYGKKLDFLAGGVDVVSTNKSGHYANYTGNSCAAPTAAGVAALMLAARPQLKWNQLRDIMRAKCDKVGGVTYDGNGHHDDYGFGRINAQNAVQEALTAVLI